MSNGITLSPKYGVNPCLTKCYLCGEDSGVMMVGLLSRARAARMFGKEFADRLHGDHFDLEAPRGVVADQEPCNKCQGYMKQGIILISVRDGEQGGNPYRTGGWVVVKAEAMRRMMQPGELRASILKKRVAFIEDAVWRKLGLPVPNAEDAPVVEAG